MKTFIFSVAIADAKFGLNLILNVYRLKTNKPTHLTEIKFNSQYSKGNKYEVLEWLVKNKQVPKKCIDKGGLVNFNEVSKFLNIYEV